MTKFPIRIGDGRPDHGVDTLPKLPLQAQDFKLYFFLEREQDTDLIFQTQGVNFAHELLINGHRENFKLCVNHGGKEDCRVPVPKQFLKKGKNSILMFNNPCVGMVCGWRDDFVVWDFSSRPAPSP